ncbi:hypothetical protein E4U42_000351, partial [Claviceps africana]
MGGRKTGHTSGSTTPPRAHRQHTPSAEERYAAQVDAQLRYLRSHYQDGRFALFPEAALGRYALE